MLKNPLLLTALAITGAIALWGIADTASLTAVAAQAVETQFASRAWFIMLTASFILLVCAGLAVSPYGKIKLGGDDDQPEFSTISWLTMLFAAGMGVGLLYYGTAEPLSHYILIKEPEGPRKAASQALFVTIFNWGLHAWAIYALTGLIIAYFSFRLGCPILVSSPILKVFGSTRLTRTVGWLSDVLAIVAIAIGLGGSIAMGVFQIREGVDVLFGLQDGGLPVTLTIFAILCLCFTLPLFVDLSHGMAILSNVAMALACVLMVFVLLFGPTHFIMGGVVQAIGEYFANAVPHGFRTFTFMDERGANWFHSWTLNYMVWWLAWAPFVGVFIARISRGRTIREFLVYVVLAPTMFSIFWFGIFGSIGFYAALNTNLPILEITSNNISGLAFFVLQQFPAPILTILAVVVAAFLFIVTSVVSAAFVLGMFSTAGDVDPPVRIKVMWGVILAALGLVMILSDSINAARSLIALGALPFVFVVLLLAICLLKALKLERPLRK